VSDDFVRVLYEASYRRLVGQLYAVCGDMTEAEDVVQEAFVRAVQHSRTVSRADNPEAWVRTVAVNQSRTRWRRRMVAERLQRDVSIQPRTPADLSPDRTALVAALRKLPASQREAIALHHLADLPVDEVARAVGAPVGTVKARLSRGRSALVDLMTDTQEANRA
jgi:RNA polymerase sigma-70 factor (ECF subfamily)